MGKVQRYIFLTMQAFAILSASTVSGIEGKSLGNGVGETQQASGPGLIKVRQGACSYTLSIKEGQHARYNDPEVVIYDSTAELRKESVPFLWQAEITSGYDWDFKNPGDPELRWVGLMCDSVENLTPSENIQDTTPSEYGQVLELNATKCPAELRNGKFSIRPGMAGDESFSFKKLSRDDWNGFLIAHKKDNGENYDRIRFCLIHDGIVLIGVAENGKPDQSIGKGFLDEIENAIGSVKFEGYQEVDILRRGE